MRYGKRLPRKEGPALITIKEIAQKAGVSVATVSRVLTDSRAVRPEHRERVMKVARECGYTPNMAARSLVKKGTGAIGVIVNLHDPFFHDLILGFETGAQQTDYHVVFASVMEDDSERKRQYVRYLSNGVVDGIILYGACYLDEPFIRELHATNFPLFLIENDVEGLKTHRFLIDNRHGVFNAVRYLYGRGHRRIAYIAGKQDRNVCVERLAGYRDARVSLGLPAREDYVRFLETGSQDGARIMGELLRMPARKRPTAVLCYDDVTAAAAIGRALKLGVSVPGELSVMGFDNQAILAGYGGPPITSVSQPLYEIGYDSVALLSRFLRGERKERITRVYTTRLVEKGTVGNNIETGDDA